MRRTILENTPLIVVGSQTLSADLTSSTIDMIGAAGNELVIQMGIGGITFDPTNRIDIKVTHSDDDITYLPVAQTDVIIDGDANNLIVDATTGNTVAYTSAHAAPDVHRVAYIGAKRYLKVFVDFGGTHGTGTPISIILVQTRPHLAGHT